MNNLTMKDIAEKVMAQQGEIVELQKTYGSTADVPTSMQIEYTDKLKSRTFEKAPFLRFLESKKQVMDNKAAYAAFYKEDTVVDPAQFIDELEDIPSVNPDTYDEVFEKMKTIVAPIETSMMSQFGTTWMDKRATQIEKNFIHVNNIADKKLVEGDKTTNSKEFDGVFKGITTNTTDLDGEKLTESTLDDVLDTVINGKGGSPDLLLTDYRVLKQFKDMVKEYRVFNDRMEIVSGFNVFTFQGPTGQLPVLVDANITKNADGESKLAVIDSSTIEVRRLMPPTLLENLPTQKLAFRDVIVTMLTMQNIAEHCNAVITGIGDGTSP